MDRALLERPEAQATSGETVERCRTNLNRVKGLRGTQHECCMENHETSVMKHAIDKHEHRAVFLSRSGASDSMAPTTLIQITTCPEIQQGKKMAGQLTAYFSPR